jgi:hypothetical protein
VARPANRRFFGRRALLNLPGHESSAAIVAEIEDTSTWKKGTGYDGKKLEPYSDIEPRVILQIANCDRSIVFNCSMDTEQEQENTLHKVMALIAALTEFRDGLLIEFPRYNERAAKVKGIKKS